MNGLGGHAAGAAEFKWIEAQDVAAAQEDSSRSRVIEADEELQQSRLTAAHGACNAESGAGWQVKCNSIQGEPARTIRGSKVLVGEVEVSNRQDGLRTRSRRVRDGSV